MTRDTVLASGVKSLRQYGYPNCTKENIMTDMIYSAFFKTSLEETVRDCEASTIQATAIRDIKQLCLALIKEIDEKADKPETKPKKSKKK